MRRALIALVVVLALAIPARLHADGPDFSPFAGDWYNHSGKITVDTQGEVWSIGGLYGSPNRDQERVIAQLTDAHGDLAYGTYTESGLPLWLLRVPGGLLLIIYAQDTAPLRVYCGADFDPDIAQQVTGLRSPCGA